MVLAPPARNIFPALLSIFRPRSPDILPPMWEGKLFFYILSSPSRAELRGDDGACPRPQGIRGYPRRVRARGCPLGAAQWEHLPRPALRTLILPGRRRRPGGGRGSPAPSPVPGSWLGVTPTTVPGDQSSVRVLFPRPSVGGVRVFVGALGVELSLHRGGGGGARRPAPSRAQEGGREHPRRGRRPGPASPPSCGARSETFVRCPLDQFF